MDLPCSKGDRIVLVDKLSQTFEGNVKSINKELGRLLLTNIIRQPGDKVVHGFRNFDRNEIVKIEIKENEKLSNNISLCDNDVNELEFVGNKLSESEHKEVKEPQNEYHYIEDFGTDFQEAVLILKQSNIVGLYAKDASKGRAERLAVMALSTYSKIFIFDLQILGDEALDKGLREVLESPNILKVVHDCRLLSDCLSHMHLVNLENVRDVEAEDVMVVHQQRKMIRHHSRSLDYLIKTYLNINVVNYYIPFETWAERPLPLKLVEFLVHFVSFLIPLQEAIEKKFLQRLIYASDIYKNHLRNSDIFDFVQSDPNTTLREELINLVKPQTLPRCDNYKSAKV